MRSYAARLLDDEFVIFLLHGVINQRRHAIRNYTRKHLPLDDFVAFLQDVMRVGTAVSMDDIVAANRQGGPLPKRAFAITFDDGFRNNADVAAPVLDDFGVPATFYVTTGFVGSEFRSWTDEIEAALESSGVVQLAGLFDEIDGSYASVPQKIVLMDRIRAYVKGSNTIDPYQFVARVIESMASRGGPFDQDLDAKLGWDQVRLLAEHSLFTIGGHSHTHRTLSFLSIEELENEISTSVRLLTDATNKKIVHYSYPEGMAHCYSDSVIAALERYGIVCSPTAVDGTNRRDDSLFHLKRVFVV